MSRSGELYQAGEYKAALEVAQRAYDDYNELQTLRSDDEDFSDLIFAAREQYEKCQQAVARQRAEALKRLEEEYAHALELKAKADKGDIKAALQAADWFADEDHWNFLHERNEKRALYYAANLYHSVAANDSAPLEYRALAAYNIGQMHFKPKYGNVNINNAMQYFKLAADMELSLESPTQDLLFPILTALVKAATYMGNIPLACQYAQAAREHGADMGIFDPVARYGVRHEEKMASELIDQMVDPPTWEGMLLRGQELYNQYLEDYTNPEKEGAYDAFKKRMVDFFEANETTDPQGAYNCLSLVIYSFYDGPDFIDSDYMDYLNKGVEEGSLWAQHYLALVYDLASDGASEQGDQPKAQEYHSQALRHQCLAANEGLRNAIEVYLWWLKNDGADKALISHYEDVARQYDIEVEE